MHKIDFLKILFNKVQLEDTPLSFIMLVANGHFDYLNAFISCLLLKIISRVRLSNIFWKLFCCLLSECLPVILDSTTSDRFGL